MIIKEYLKENQPVFYETLKKSIENERIPNAFLLCAQKGVDLHQVAMFIAKSIICNEDILACEACNTCRRIDEDDYLDVKRLDGNEESIKIAQLNEIYSQFSLTATEGKHKVYILEKIENSNPKVANALLKTLEEPMPGMYAILTCDNINNVLPTIISRCQVVHFKSMSNKQLVNESIRQGIKEEDANILSQVYDTVEKIIEVSQSELYFDLKVEVLNFIEDYFFKRENLMINAQTHVFKKHQTKEELLLFLDILTIAFKDVLYHHYGMTLSFCNHQDLFNRIRTTHERVVHAIETILYAKEQLNRRANAMLLMDSMMYRM